MSQHAEGFDKGYGEAAGPRDAEIAKLRGLLSHVLDTVNWMSGSDDFSPNGKAGKEWANRRAKVFEAMDHLRATT